LLLTCADSFVNDAGNAIQKCKLNAHELVVIDVELLIQASVAFARSLMTADRYCILTLRIV